MNNDKNIPRTNDRISEIEKLKSLGLLAKKLAGPSTRYPDGKLNDADEGELQIKIGTDELKTVVIIELGKPVAWIGMPPQQAVELAQTLIKHARAASKVPLVVEI